MLNWWCITWPVRFKGLIRDPNTHGRFPLPILLPKLFPCLLISNSEVLHLWCHDHALLNGIVLGHREQFAFPCTVNISSPAFSNSQTDACPYSVCMYIGFKTFFYAVRHLDSTASYLPTGLHCSFRAWPSLSLPSSFSSVFLKFSMPVHILQNFNVDTHLLRNSDLPQFKVCMILYRHTIMWTRLVSGSYRTVSTAARV